MWEVSVKNPQQKQLVQHTCAKPFVGPQGTVYLVIADQ